MKPCHAMKPCIITEEAVAEIAAGEKLENIFYADYHNQNKITTKTLCTLIF